MFAAFDQKIQDNILDYIPDEELLTLIADIARHSSVDAPPEYGGSLELEEEDSSDEEPGADNFVIDIDEPTWGEWLTDDIRDLIGWFIDE